MTRSNSSTFPLGARPGQQWQVNDQIADLSRPALEPRPLVLEAMPKKVCLDAAKTAVIVVDMQNDFCTPGGWLDHIGVDVAPAWEPVVPLQALLPALRQAGVPVIWVNWGNREDLKNISPALLHVYNGSGQDVGLGDHLPSNGAKVLTKDHWGAAIVDALQPAPEDIHVDKFRMSGFWDTPLDSILRNLGVTTCLFAGVNADQCVLHTLADANFLGYDTLLLEDCTATTSPAFCMEATLYNARQIFGFTALSADLISALEAQ